MNEQNLTDEERVMYASTGKLYHEILIEQGCPEMPKELQTEETFVVLGIEAFKALEKENDEIF